MRGRKVPQPTSACPFGTFESSMIASRQSGTFNATYGS